MRRRRGLSSPWKGKDAPICQEQTVNLTDFCMDHQPIMPEVNATLFCALGADEHVVATQVTSNIISSGCTRHVIENVLSIFLKQNCSYLSLHNRRPRRLMHCSPPMLDHRVAAAPRGLTPRGHARRRGSPHKELPSSRRRQRLHRLHLGRRPRAAL